MKDQALGTLILTRAPGQSFSVQTPDGVFRMKFVDWEEAGGIYIKWWVGDQEHRSRVRYYRYTSDKCFCGGKMRIQWHPDYGSLRMKFHITAPRNWTILRSEVKDRRKEG